MVLTRRIQTTLQRDTKASARAEATRLQMGDGATSRLRALCGQYRIAARRGLAPSVPRCHDRLRRGFEEDDSGDRSQGKAWGWILQEYAGCGVAFQATSKPAPPGAHLWRERALGNVRHISCSQRTMAHARTYGSAFSQVAARA